MANHFVTFDDSQEPVEVSTGTLLTDAAAQAGVYIAQPCGGQGRCGRCAVKVLDGGVRRRSTLRLSPEDVADGYALACQSVIEGDARIVVPDQETLERTLTTDRVAAEVQVPAGYDPLREQSIRQITLTLTPPSMDDQIDDWSRLQRAVGQQTGIANLQVSLPLLQKIGAVLREGEWRVTAVIENSEQLTVNSEQLTVNSQQSTSSRLIALYAGHVADNAPLWGLAIDIGTTTVSVWLVDLLTGEVAAQAAEYNRQIQRGEDVISRIIYASKNNGQAELRDLVLKSINTLVERVVKRAGNKWQVASNEQPATSNQQPAPSSKPSSSGTAP